MKWFWLILIHNVGMSQWIFLNVMLSKTVDDYQRWSYSCVSSSSHVKRVVNIVRKFRPGMRVLIWDDVIRGDQFVNNEKLVSDTIAQLFSIEALLMRALNVSPL